MYNLHRLIGCEATTVLCKVFASRLKDWGNCTGLAASDGDSTSVKIVLLLLLGLDKFPKLRNLSFSFRKLLTELILSIWFGLRAL